MTKREATEVAKTRFGRHATIFWHDAMGWVPAHALRLAEFLLAETQGRERSKELVACVMALADPLEPGGCFMIGGDECLPRVETPATEELN